MRFAAWKRVPPWLDDLGALWRLATLDMIGKGMRFLPWHRKSEQADPEKKNWCVNKEIREMNLPGHERDTGHESLHFARSCSNSR